MMYGSSVLSTVVPITERSEMGLYDQQSMFTLALTFVSIILYFLVSLFSTILYSILLISINLLLKKKFKKK